MATQKGADRWKQKKWFEIRAPKVFEGKMICEIPGNEEKYVMDRKLKIALSQLTGDPGHAFANVTLKVSEVNGNVALTNLIMIEQLQSYIRSLVRRGRNVADCVLPLKTSDGKNVVLKMIAITAGRAKSSDLSNIRKEIVVFMGDYVKGKDFDQLVKMIIEGRLQADLGGKLQKIIPMSKVEVKKFEVPMTKVGAGRKEA
jgi:small subunit ribosomal protein S3Ae